MKVKMITTMAGPGIVAVAGQEVDIQSVLAKDLIAGGYAVSCEGFVREIETTEMPLPENAMVTMKQKAKRRK